jgi:hypothetical protein
MKYFIIIALFSFHSVVSQVNIERKSHNHEFNIQQMGINNPLITDAIKVFIQQKKNKIKSFKDGYGFVALNMLSYKINHKPMNINDPDLQTFYKDTIVSFTLELRSHPLLLNNDPEIFLSTSYPPFYTFVDGTLVLLYDNVMNIYNSSSFSTKTMKKLSKIVSNRLKNAFDSDFVFKHPFENMEYTLTKEDRRTLTTKDIYKRSCMNLMESEYVYILRNGDVLKKEN